MSIRAARRIKSWARTSATSLRPLPRDQITTLSLDHELEICDRALEPQRCALLDGLLGWGPVTDREFPVDMPTFGGQR